MTLRERPGERPAPVETSPAPPLAEALRASVPSATYRLQLGQDLGFARARRLVPYLESLGVSTLYLSPILRARGASAHGYDVVDPRALDPRLGTDADLWRLATAARARGLSLLLDVVPNHMAASHESPLWRALLEDGESAASAPVFDVDWRRVRHAGGRIALPVLGEPYASALDGGRLRVVLEGGRLVLAYWDHRFPLDPATLAPFLASVARGRRRSRSLARVARAFERIPRRDDLERRPERLRRKSVAAALLRELSRSPSGRLALEAGLARLSADELDALVAAQGFRPGFWRSTVAAIPYRRFFDISDLVGVRVEDPAVFEATHRKILALVRDGVAAGLRIDHVDGLLDPRGYLERLRARVGSETYLVVEKILTGDERLPASWPVDGTTGYEFLKAVSGVFADARGLRALDRLHARFTGSRARFSELAWASKARVLSELFPGELAALAQSLAELAPLDREAQDVAATDLARALAAVTASLSVYRTYTRTEPAARDRTLVESAVAVARRRRPQVDGRAFAFVRRVLTLDFSQDSRLLPAAREAVARWQQLTGPVMAKGLEDTALYAYARLLSLNVIGTRRSRARSLAELHAFQAGRAARGDLSLLATTTHDTKRSEDVQARIHVLSEIAEDWSERVLRWSRWNEPHRRRLRDHVAPSPSEELLLYQTLLGAWPGGDEPGAPFLERLRGYLVKAAREAKVHTSWLAPREEHERALTDFATRILEPGPRNAFLGDFHAFRPRVELHGAINALAQLVVKLGSPGVADVYQGSELWDLRLVDPDNRGRVDLEARARLLRALDRRDARDRAALLAELRSSWPDGRVKLWVTSRGLRFRRRERELFLSGEYLPLAARGEWRDHVVGFARRRGDRWALVLVPRLLARRFELVRFPEGEALWGEAAVHLPPGAPREWRNVLTGATVATSRGRRLALGQVWSDLPVALLEG